MQQIQSISFGVPIGAPSEIVSVEDISETSNGTPGMEVGCDGAGEGVVEDQVQEAVAEESVPAKADMVAELQKSAEVDEDEEW